MLTASIIVVNRITRGKASEPDVALEMGMDPDESENKYAKRPVSERFARVVS